MPVVRTDGRSVYGHVITKFSRMGSLPHFFTQGAPLRALRARQLRYNRIGLQPRGHAPSRHQLKKLRRLLHKKIKVKVAPNFCCVFYALLGVLCN